MNFSIHDPGGILFIAHCALVGVGRRATRRVPATGKKIQREKAGSGKTTDSPIAPIYVFVSSKGVIVRYYNRI